MHAKRFHVLAAAMLLGLSTLGETAEAGRCRQGRPCGGWAAGDRAPYVELQMAPHLGRKGRRARPLLGLFSHTVGSDEVIADNGNSDAGLIPESMAVAQAQAAYPNGKALRVKLLPGPNPLYDVKLRVDGQVLRVFVDAQTGQIVGQ